MPLVRSLMQSGNYRPGFDFHAGSQNYGHYNSCHPLLEIDPRLGQHFFVFEKTPLLGIEWNICVRNQAII